MVAPWWPPSRRPERPCPRPSPADRRGRCVTSSTHGRGHRRRDPRGTRRDATAPASRRRARPRPQTRSPSPGETPKLLPRPRLARASSGLRERGVVIPRGRRHLPPPSPTFSTNQNAREKGGSYRCGSLQFDSSIKMFSSNTYQSDAAACFSSPAVASSQVARRLHSFLISGSTSPTATRT